MRGRKESWKTAEAQVLTIAAEGLLSCFLLLPAAAAGHMSVAEAVKRHG